MKNFVLAYLAILIARALGIALLAAFLLIGFVALTPAVVNNQGSIPLAPEISADAVFGRLNSTDLTERTLQRWRKDAVLLLIAPSSNPNAIKVYYELIILAYPRRVSAMFCESHAGVPPLQQQWPPRTGPIEGLIFYDIPPGPDAAGAKEVAPKLYMTAHKGKPEWKSVCR